MNYEKLIQQGYTPEQAQRQVLIDRNEQAIADSSFYDPLVNGIYNATTDAIGGVSRGFGELNAGANEFTNSINNSFSDGMQLEDFTDIGGAILNFQQDIGSAGLDVTQGGVSAIGSVAGGVLGTADNITGNVVSGTFGEPVADIVNGVSGS